MQKRIGQIIRVKKIAEGGNCRVGDSNKKSE